MAGRCTLNIALHQMNFRIISIFLPVGYSPIEWNFFLCLRDSLAPSTLPGVGWSQSFLFWCRPSRLWNLIQSHAYSLPWRPLCQTTWICLQGSALLLWLFLKCPFLPSSFGAPSRSTFARLSWDIPWVVWMCGSPWYWSFSWTKSRWESPQTRQGGARTWCRECISHPLNALLVPISSYFLLHNRSNIIKSILALS